MSSAQHRRNSNRRKARGGGEPTYDGVTDWAIYRRDGWECKMPECLCGDGREISQDRTQRASAPGATGDPWRASIDHIVPLAEGGRDDAANKRSAHALCNEAGQEHWGRGRQPLSYTIGERYADLEETMRP
jgi:hypothetical protein